MDNEQTNENTETICGTCKYWMLLDIADINHGACRRFPPHVFMLNSKDGPVVQSQFPPIGRKSQCGEYSRKLSLIN